MKLSNLFMASFVLSMSVNALAHSTIRKEYTLGGGNVFFTDPSDKGSNTTTVDYFDAQCDHYEFNGSKENEENGSSTTHLFTLTLTPCERTDVHGVKAHPISGDQVIDTFDGVVSNNLAKFGKANVINGRIYQAGETRLIKIASVDISSFPATEEGLQQAEEAKAKIAAVKAACEDRKKLEITKATGDAAKADKIISTLSTSGEGTLQMESALDENIGKCVRSYPYQMGKAVLNDAK